MKRFLLLIVLLASVACTKDLTEDPAGGAGEAQQEAIVVGRALDAVPGTIAMKVLPEVAEAIDAVQKTRSGVQTRSGVDQMDLVFNQIGVEHFFRMIPYNYAREDALRECGLNLWYRIEFDEAESLEKVVNLLKACSDIEVVEYTYRPQKMNVGPVHPLTGNEGMYASNAETRATMPMNDPLLSSQWHYKNTGPTSTYPKRKAGADINLFDAWTLCTGGEDIIVAVIDEPVQYSHPDLAANMWTNPNTAEPGVHGYNFWNRKADLDWSGRDSYGSYADHGTHVAGTIAAVNNNGVGCCGIAGGKNGGGVKIMSCQIMGNVMTNYDNDADIKAFTWASDRGAVIAQCSFGYSSSMTEAQWNAGHGSRRAAIDYFIKSSGSKNPKFPNSPLEGGLVIFAAGNDGDVVKDKKTWPSAYAPVIAVASIGWDFQPSYFTDYGTWCDITAPGGDHQLVSGPAADRTYASGVFSTILQDPSMSFVDDRNAFGVGSMQGTSMACPHVSGVAALGLAYASKNGLKFTTAEFASLLLSSTYDLTPYLTGIKSFINSDGKRQTLTLSDYRGKMGRGGLDAMRLLLAIKGTPALYLEKGVAKTIDLSQFFGGAASTLLLKSVEIDAAARQRVGLSSVPAFVNGTMTFNCPSIGSAIVKVTCLAGDMPITREFAIIVRDNVASNGGWL